MPDSMFRAPGQKGASRILRWAVPIVMIAVGIGALVFGSGYTADGIGVALSTGAVVVLFAGWFGRLGNDSERIREQSARDEYARTGHWPSRD